MVRPLYIIGSGVLKRRAKPTDGHYQQLQELLDDLTDTAKAANTIGLAGPQVGISLRIAVVKLESGVFLHLINPEYEWRSTEQTIEIEGCISVPGVKIEISRPKEVSIAGTKYKGAEARAIQHMVDHLDGLLITDYAVPVRAT